MGSFLIEIDGIQIRANQDAEAIISETYLAAVERDRVAKGHQEGYSGGWNTVSTVEIRGSARLDHESSSTPCPVCYGSGRDYEGRGGATCRRCDGSGRVLADLRARSIRGIFPSLAAAHDWADEKVWKRDASAVRYRDGRKIRWAIFGRAVI